jgi:hypothetical protein
MCIKTNNFKFLWNEHLHKIEAGGTFGPKGAGFGFPRCVILSNGTSDKAICILLRSAAIGGSRRLHLVRPTAPSSWLIALLRDGYRKGSRMVDRAGAAC